jgi:hypothetical protein
MSSCILKGRRSWIKIAMNMEVVELGSVEANQNAQMWAAMPRNYVI